MCFLSVSALRLLSLGILARGEIVGRLSACEDEKWHRLRRFISCALYSCDAVDAVADETLRDYTRIALTADHTKHADCILGYAVTRMSYALFLEGEAREHFVNANFNHFKKEWNLFVSIEITWYHLLCDEWGDLIHEILYRLSDSNVFGTDSSLSEASCSDAQKEFLNADETLERERLNELAAAYLIDEIMYLDDIITTEGGSMAKAGWPLSLVTSIENIDQWTPCHSMAVAKAFLILGTANDTQTYHITPGYAFYATQQSFARSIMSGPRPIFRSSFFKSGFVLLRQLANTLREHKQHRIQADDTAQEAETLTKKEGSEAHASSVSKNVYDDMPGFPKEYAPPWSQGEEFDLVYVLRAVHSALGSIHVKYSLSAGTLLGAMRHHGFIPWDGEADVCGDLMEEASLLLFTLLQPTRMASRPDVQVTHGGAEWPLLRHRQTERLKTMIAATTVMSAEGVSVVAHCDKALAYKFYNHLNEPIRGEAFSFPNVEFLFWHSVFSTQSEGVYGEDVDLHLALESYYGPVVKRTQVLPLRKAYFAGSTFWVYREPEEVLDVYYGKTWSSECLASEGTFFREHRKFVQGDEAFRTAYARQSCSILYDYFAFASHSDAYLPPSITQDVIESHLHTLCLRVSHRPKLPLWATVHGFATEALLWPFSSDEAATVRITDVKSSSLHGRNEGNEVMYHMLTSLVVVPASPREVKSVHGATREPSCEILLRFVPFPFQTNLRFLQTMVSITSALHSFSVTSHDSLQFYVEVLSMTCSHFTEDMELQFSMEAL
eukprot:TRINITY_DN14268_c0_g1_i1.p1 TRINITY_DN14268_c0_g1~~TRINITY_DN14268_c0_g1_i1.p1  ORF type:complete len:779 (-),score=51.32 TRINITY_DN14268_c0_g1_i1:218-2554(-)